MDYLPGPNTYSSRAENSLNLEIKSCIQMARVDTTHILSSEKPSLFILCLAFPLLVMVLWHLVNPLPGEDLTESLRLQCKRECEIATLFLWLLFVKAGMIPFYCSFWQGICYCKIWNKLLIICICLFLLSKLKVLYVTGCCFSKHRNASWCRLFGDVCIRSIMS